MTIFSATAGKLLQELYLHAIHIALVVWWIRDSITGWSCMETSLEQYFSLILSDAIPMSDESVEQTIFAWEPSHFGAGNRYRVKIKHLKWILQIVILSLIEQLPKLLRLLLVSSCINSLKEMIFYLTIFFLLFSYFFFPFIFISSFFFCTASLCLLRGPSPLFSFSFFWFFFSYMEKELVHYQ